MIKDKILELKNRLGVAIFAHFYQVDDVFNCADVTGDSLELAKRSMEIQSDIVLFCGVGFMGQSVKILSPNKRVFMPKIACCSMAKMIDENLFSASIEALESRGVSREKILPITYINSSAEVKASVGKFGGMVCTSSNAHKIIESALKSGKKILFIPDRCLGQNIANKMGKTSSVIGRDKDFESAEIICYDGFCSVHQLFCEDDIKFYKERYDDILIITHPECDPSVVALSDFVGSTSEIIKYVKSLPLDQKVAIGTEFNLVNRLRDKNTFILSSTKPECPTMNETTLEDLYACLKAIERGSGALEITLDEEISKWAKISLQRMLELS